MKQSKTFQNHLFTITLFLFAEIFYLFFAWKDKIFLESDSQSYINMDLAREPFYPMFLALIRNIPGLNIDYLFLVVILQSILAGLSVFMITSYLQNILSLNTWITLFIYIFPFLVSLLCRYGSKRGAMYSNSILSEGITISLFLIFFRFLLEYTLEHTKKSFVWCIILSTILISTRKQMMISLFLLLLVIFFRFIGKNWKRAFVEAILIGIIVLFVSTIYDCGYNYFQRGIFARHSSDTRFLTTVGFYITDEEDINRIEDATVKSLASDIYEICTQNQYTHAFATGGWSERVDHFMNHYDLIQINTMWSMVQSYAVNEEHLNPEQASFRTDEILDAMNKALFFSNLTKAVPIFLDNFRYGLITTVAQKNRILNLYSVIAYLGFVLLWLFRLLQYRKNHAEKTRRILLISGLAMISVLINVTLVAAVIFCQPRYTIYNMALFYIAGTLLLVGTGKTK